MFIRLALIDCMNTFFLIDFTASLKFTSCKLFLQLYKLYKMIYNDHL